MGDIRHYNCKCGYEKNIFHGCGLNAIRMSMVERFFPEEAKIIAKSIENNENTSFSVGNVLAVCNECKELKTSVVLRYSINQGREKIVYLNKCDVCGNDMDVIDDTQTDKKIACPKCNSDMEFQVTGNWD